MDFSKAFDCMDHDHLIAKLAMVSVEMLSSSLKTI